LLVSTVETVRGPVDVTKLGRALMHEHVFILQPEALQNYLSHDAASFIDFMVGDPAFANEKPTTSTSRRRSCRLCGAPASPTSRSTT
jgi:hypothetical protein